MTPSRWIIFLAVVFTMFLGLELWAVFSEAPTLSQSIWGWSDATPVLGAVMSFPIGFVFGHFFWGREARNLIVKKDFISASGLHLGWKIECDEFHDWAAIADICGPRLPAFGKVISVPTGGDELADEMAKHITDGSPLVLIVDDVLTTGSSMAEVAANIPLWFGFVAFSRGKLPQNVLAFMETKF